MNPRQPTHTSYPRVLKQGCVLTLFLFLSQTYASHRILIAVNPYDKISQQYGTQQIARYLADENLYETPPHIYAIGKYWFLKLLFFPRSV